MIDHISLRVSDFQRSLTFYKAALEPLGYTLVFSNDQEQYAGFAGPDRERIWIGHRETASHGYAHIAVLAKDRATVRKFYDAAMTMAGPVRGRNTVPPTTARSCWIRMVTISRRSASRRVSRIEASVTERSEGSRAYCALAGAGRRNVRPDSSPQRLRMTENKS